MRKIISACVLSLLLAFASYAQSDKGFSTCPSSMSKEACQEAVEFLGQKSARSVRPDFFVPDSPAFSVLSVTPENTIRPESTRDLSVALLNGVDPKGNLQSGLAIDTAPYILTGVDLADYRNDPLERFLSRSQVSIATTKGGSDDDNSLRASIGLRLTLLDKGDARMDTGLDATFYSLLQASRRQETLKLMELEDKLENSAKELNKAQREGDDARVKQITEVINALDGEREALENQMEKNLQEQWTSALIEHEKGQWNATSATLGIAPIFFSEKGNFDDIEAKGFAVYGTFSYGFEHLGGLPAEKGAGRWLRKNANLLLHVRFVGDEKESLKDGSDFREQNSFVLGGQLRLQGPKLWSEQKGGDLAFGLETDYIYKDFDGGGNDDLLRFTGVVEIKPFKNSGLTFKAAVGGESGNEDDDDAFIITSVNWALD